MYIRNKKMQNGKNYYVIEDRIKLKRKYITKNIRYLGSVKKILSDLEELDRLRQKKS